MSLTMLVLLTYNNSIRLVLLTRLILLKGAISEEVNNANIEIRNFF